MEKAATTLKKISSDQLDKILSKVLDEKHAKFVLLGPDNRFGDRPDKWPDAIQDSGVIYQLTEAVDNLVDKLILLTDLRCLVLWGHSIGDVGAIALAKLTKLNTLNVSYNEIGDAGAIALANLRLSRTT